MTVAAATNKLLKASDSGNEIKINNQVTNFMKIPQHAAVLVFVIFHFVRSKNKRKTDNEHTFEWHQRQNIHIGKTKDKKKQNIQRITVLKILHRFVLYFKLNNLTVGPCVYRDVVALFFLFLSLKSHEFSFFPHILLKSLQTTLFILIRIHPSIHACMHIYICLHFI